MNRDDIIRMAREATDEPCPYDNGGVTWSFTEPELERFANLVAAERDKKWQVLLDEIDKYSAVCSEGIKLSGDLSLAAIDVAVAAEREACARVCEERGRVKGGEVFAARIRAER